MSKETLPARVEGHRWLYAMQAEDRDLFKIGVTVNLTTRLAQMQKRRDYIITVAFAFLLPWRQAEFMEGLLHAKLYSILIGFDWFLISGPDLEETMEYHIRIADIRFRRFPELAEAAV